MSHLPVIIALITANVFFGLGYSFNKALLMYMEPGTWIFVRMCFHCALMLLVFGRALVNQAVTLKTLFWLVVCTLFGMLINQICMIEGLHRSIPAHVAIINATIPLQTLLYARLVGLERFNGPKLAAIAIGFLSIAYLLGLDQLKLGSGYGKGDVLAFINSAAYSVFLVISGRVLKQMDVFLVLTWMSVFGVIGAGFYAGWEFPAQVLVNLPLIILGYIFFLVVIQSILNYALYLWALKRIHPSFAALFMYVQPIVATWFGYLMFGHEPSERFYHSAVFILIAILLGTWGQRRT